MADVFDEAVALIERRAEEYGGTAHAFMRSVASRLRTEAAAVRRVVAEARLARRDGYSIPGLLDGALHDLDVAHHALPMVRVTRG